jgi:hypothetical protein
MLRWTKWVTPVAALVLMAGFQAGQARGDDAATPTPDGKATVTVTVVDSDGKPVPSATVTIAPAPAKKSKKSADATSQPDAAAPKTKVTPLETGTTSADGKFALTKIPDGDYLVVARVKGVGRGQAKVTIADDKDEAVSVTLKARKAAAN